MHFAPDTEYTLNFSVVMANTHPGATKSGEDELSTIAQLDTLVRRYGYTGRLDLDAAELADVRATRERERHVWLLPRDEAAEEVNAIFREIGALPYLTRHPPFDWHLHATAQDAPLGERMLGEFALGLMDVIRTDEMGRLRECEAPDCTGILADLSRNGSKRFCSIRCGNRMNMVAYRARQ